MHGNCRQQSMFLVEPVVAISVSCSWRLVWEVPHPIAKVLAVFKVQAPVLSDALRCFRDVFVDVLAGHVVRSSSDVVGVVAFGMR